MRREYGVEATLSLSPVNTGEFRTQAPRSHNSRQPAPGRSHQNAVLVSFCTLGARGQAGGEGAAGSSPPSPAVAEFRFFGGVTRESVPSALIALANRYETETLKVITRLFNAGCIGILG
jgi:hypothetical protein